MVWYLAAHPSSTSRATSPSGAASRSTSAAPSRTASGRAGSTTAPSAFGGIASATGGLSRTRPTIAPKVSEGHFQFSINFGHLIYTDYWAELSITDLWSLHQSPLWLHKITSSLSSLLFLFKNRIADFISTSHPRLYKYYKSVNRPRPISDILESTFRFFLHLFLYK